MVTKYLDNNDNEMYDVQLDALGEGIYCATRGQLEQLIEEIKEVLNGC